MVINPISETKNMSTVPTCNLWSGIRVEAKKIWMSIEERRNLKKRGQSWVGALSHLNNSFKCREIFYATDPRLPL
jgi:hypothetical protein